jgi:hypothetical protein
MFTDCWANSIVTLIHCAEKAVTGFLKPPIALCKQCGFVSRDSISAIYTRRFPCGVRIILVLKFSNIFKVIPTDKVVRYKTGPNLQSFYILSAI